MVSMMKRAGLASLALAALGCVGGGGGGGGGTVRCSTNNDCGNNQYCDLPAQKAGPAAPAEAPPKTLKQDPEGCIEDCFLECQGDEQCALTCAFNGCFPDCGAACSYLCDGDQGCIDAECLPDCRARTGGGGQGGAGGGAGGAGGGAGGEGGGFGGEGGGVGGEGGFGGGAGGGQGGAGGGQGGAGGGQGGAGGGQPPPQAQPPGICRNIPNQPRNDMGGGAGGAGGGFGGAGGGQGGAGGGGQGGAGGGQGGAGGGGQMCDGDFSLGSTFVVGDTVIGPCNQTPPTNCNRGFWVSFSDGECLCTVQCGDFNPPKQIGEACDNDGNFTCQEVRSSNGNNQARICVGANWNLCTVGGGGGGQGGAGGGGQGGAGGQGGQGGSGGGEECLPDGSSCSFDSDCCNESCSFGTCEEF